MTNSSEGATGLVTESGADLSRAHLVGAGGSGMSAVGTLLLERGAQVSGSDAKASQALAALDDRGARTAVGQRPENLDLLPGGPTAVVVSSAIRPDNPELVEAHRRGLPVVHRAAALAALMAGHRSVCVTGTHGKTSTTSMLTVALRHAGLDPSFAIGGELSGSGTGAHAGTGDVFIAEADESDGSFLAFAPHGAIVTAVEPDHLDHHGTPAAYAAVFEQFVDRVAPGGFLVAGVDDPGVRALLDAVRAAGGGPRIVGYGTAKDADVRLESWTPQAPGATGLLVLPGGSRVQLTVPVPGAHMLANASAALAAGMQLGVEAEAMVAGLAAYTGARRRFEFKGQVGSVRVYDDYAHNPTKVAAAIAGARTVAGDGRLVVVFQPHLYSRTATFADAFGRALAGADVVVVLDVYGAREDPAPGVSGALVAEAIPAGGTEVHYVPDFAAVPARVAALLRPDDLVITMGAGDVTSLGPELLDELARGGAGGGDER
jgi:UDP-N-acetylmuramate--alanine ligase